LAVISRKGVGSREPFLTMRMRPGFSRMNRRPEPSPALVTKTGEVRPLATCWKLKLAGLITAKLRAWLKIGGLAETVCALAMESPPALTVEKIRPARRMVETSLRIERRTPE
jgi:hypothetical protein